MGAPKGNKFWEARASHGRPGIFADDQELWSSCVEYFDWCHDNPLEEAIVYQGQLNEQQVKPHMRAMTLDGLCIFLGIARKTWQNYRERDDFLQVTETVEQVIRTQKFEGAAAGLLNPNIIARDLKLADPQEVTHREDLTPWSEIETGEDCD